MDEMQLKEAAKLWREGVKSADIGAKFGMSGKQITAYASKHRDTFPKRTAEIFQANGFSAGNIVRRAEALTTVKERWPPKSSQYPGVTSGQLTACGCAFPLWGDHERFNVATSLYCGGPKADGRPYCSFHCNVARGDGTPSEAGLFDSLKGTADSLSVYIEPVQSLLGVVAANWWILAAAGGLGVFWYARKMKLARLADYQTGRTV